MERSSSSRGGCGWWIFVASSTCGILFGITIFFLFTFHYHNSEAGIFGLFSGILAAICLHLKLLRTNNRLLAFYKAPQLHIMSIAGTLIFLIALGFTIFFIVYAAFNHIPMLPVGGSYYLASVWSGKFNLRVYLRITARLAFLIGMTAKWSATLAILSYRYSKFIQYSTPFLVQENGS